MREGTKLVIHPDQCRQWQSKGEKYAEEFNSLREEHAAKYESMLTTIIQQSSSAASVSTPAAVTAAAAEAEDDAGDPAPEAAEEEQPLVTFESLEKLQAADPVAVKVVSEIAGVELIRTNSKKIFLYAEKAKAIPRNAILGGFGTGKQLA